MKTAQVDRERTLYQCFFTLPSVRVGKVLAISLQLLPASRRVFSRCSSAGVHGVFVLPFFATGLGNVAEEGPIPLSNPANSLEPVLNCALVKPLALELDEPGKEGSPSSDARRLREL